MSTFGKNDFSKRFGSLSLLEAKSEGLSNENYRDWSRKHTRKWKKFKLTKQYESNCDLKFVAWKMDPKVKQQNMNLDLEKNQDAKQKLYETSNRGTILEPRNLQTKIWPTWH